MLETGTRQQENHQNIYVKKPYTTLRFSSATIYNNISNTRITISSLAIILANRFKK